MYGIKKMINNTKYINKLNEIKNEAINKGDSDVILYLQLDCGKTILFNLKYNNDNKVYDFELQKLEYGKEKTTILEIYSNNRTYIEFAFSK